MFDGRTVRRVWRPKQALRAVNWLKHRNGRGGHVFLRPATTACVLVEDLSADALAEVRGDGLTPAAVLQASPASFQAWFRLGRELGPKLGTCVAQVLAGRYGGDPARADARRMGRAAGFLNRAAELAGPGGRYPRVLLDEARGRVTPRADELVAAAEERLARREAERAAGAPKVKAGNGRAKDPRAFLDREVGRIAERHGKGTDWSRAFAAAARRMALAGYAQAEVKAALASSSELRRRRRGGADDFAGRTVAWAFGAVRRRPR
ncbi:MAG: DNA-primase RepB domain-containing protein [Rhodospirillaceae bacterium]|nr:DNA-primase RepB domain-containing protein [Rhodospirillaceae bacterium]